MKLRALASPVLALLRRLSPPPPPPPPVQSPLWDGLAPALLAVLVCWLLPALLYVRFAREGTATSTGAGSAARAGAGRHRGVLYGSLSSFLSVTAMAVMFPFMQVRRDALGCDALCQGGQTSLRSALTLVGAAVIGRASDRVGRVPMLWVGTAASLASIVISLSSDSLTGMWLAVVPAALLNQNFSVCKALFSDYIDEAGGTDADKAGAVGKLGMAVGFSFMVGPILASALISDYRRALLLSAAITAASSVFLLLLPTPSKLSRQQRGGGGGGGSSSAGLTGFLSLPVLKLRGAQLLMLVRLKMALAFHMFAPVWQVSIRARFDFGPRDHAQFMGLVGLTYALSQGFIAKPLVRSFGDKVSRLLLLCILVLGGARPVALYTQSVGVVYACYVPMVIALGVMNTAITTAASRLAQKEQLGGFYGVMESVENVAGMVGPALGGLLARVDGFPATLAAVVCFYAAAFVLVALFFSTHVSGAAAAEAAAPAAISSEQPPSDVPAVPLAPATPPRPSVGALPAHASPAAARMTVRGSLVRSRPSEARNEAKLE